MFRPQSSSPVQRILNRNSVSPEPSPESEELYKTMDNNESSRLKPSHTVSSQPETNTPRDTQGSINIEPNLATSTDVDDENGALKNFSLEEPEEARLSDSSADKAVMEMANLITNPGDVPGATLPASGMKRTDSSEALNLTLHQCARDGDETNMKIVLKNISGHLKKKVNALDDEDLTPLHYAARYNHLSVVKLLVDAGADPNAKGEDEVTPLHTAARYRREKNKRKETNSPEEGETAESNIAANGLPQLVEYLESIENSGDSCISFLVKNGARVNVVDIYGQTPLHFAAMRGNEIAARDLLSFSDINVEAQDKQGITALHMAAIHNQEGVAAMLIEAGSNLRCVDHEQSTPLHHACSEGNVAFVQMLFDAGARSAEGWVMVSSMLTDRDVEESTCLHLAVDNGHYDVAKLCLEKRADVNVPRKHYMHPLHLAAMSGDIRNVKLLMENNARIDVLNDEQATPLHKAAQLNHLAVVKYLVDQGAKINRRDKDNYTPLLLAVTYGHVETVELLLQKGADYTAVDKNDKTIIYLAAEENKAPVLKKLLSYPQVKRLINQSDRYDNDPLHIAAQSGYSEILVTLLENGADLDSKNEEEQTPLHLAGKFGRTNNVRELVKRDKSSINDEDENSNTPLHLAAMQGHDKAVALLLEFGADVASRNYSQWTPLDLAASKGWMKTCRILLEDDAPIDPMDKNQTTPLHLACRNGHAPVVSLLLEWDADVTLPDSDGLNSLDIAIENHNIDVAMVIINSEVWEDALRHASLDLVTGQLDTPMRKLIRKMPDVAERVFDRCLSYGAEKNPGRPEYEITFNYEFLDDVYANWLDTKRESTSESGSSSGFGVYDEDDRLLAGATPYTSDSNMLKKNHPLMIMVTSSREDLLAHPLVMSMLNHKWNTFGSVFYYLFFLLYLVFLTFLTAYIIETRPPYKFNSTDADAIASGSCDQLTTSYQQPLISVIAKYVIIGLAAFNLLKELLQIYQAKLSYLGWTNLIEWITYVSALLLVVDFNDCQKDTGYRLDWQWSLGAVSVFLAWMVLVLFIQKFPRFGIYVVMFTEILTTVAQFFVVFFLFIVAFSLGFYTLFQNQIAFQNVPSAMIKTGVMMIGEFEFDGIFNEQFKSTTPDEKDRVLYPEVSYLLFVIFLILMSIIVMNLLVGLAVDDIKAVQDQAALKRMAMQVDLALDVERILPDFIRRKSYIRRKTFKPNQWLSNPVRRLLNYQSSMSAQAIQKALNPELDEIEKVQESQEKLHGDMKKMKRIVKELREQNSRIESMLRAIVTQTENIHWQEEDYQEDEDELDQQTIENSLS
ncbi:transient receptor potential cation channel subfamily A member 1 homolog isoform X2 [Haliotis rubra]|uniref:transient receptor potential cation channel subfamily A member 1 homolog isoform X2 n=1 Tax=Haliotis rubra TaxID=36100 RepID=UPI001EE53A91|nr:transient receptor potential cation channel subfamily A member 1 homolog isoform X2 [Haliotis rubra]